jgi:hypothetical protein
MQLFANATRWLVFAAVAIGTSYLLRLVAARATRAGARRLAEARRALGLAPTPPRFLEAESEAEAGRR